MRLSKSDLFPILLVLVITALIGINELGYGLIGYALLMPVALWQMTKVFEGVDPK